MTVDLAFNPRQPRAKDGKWTGGKFHKSDALGLMLYEEKRKKDPSMPEPRSTSKARARAQKLHRQAVLLAAQTGGSLLSNEQSGADLAHGFDPNQPRDQFGRWVGGHFWASAASAGADALRAAPTGSRFTTKDGSIQFEKTTLETWQPLAGGKPQVEEHMDVKGFLQSPDDLRREHNAKQGARDLERLQGKSAKRKKAKGFLSRIKSLSTEQYGSTDLAWSAAARAGAVAARRKRGVHRPADPVTRRAQAKVMHRQIRNLQKATGSKTTGRLDSSTLASVKARAAQPGHFRAKAILAASRGNVKRAANMTARQNAFHKQRVIAKKATARANAMTQPSWTKHTKPIPPKPVTQSTPRPRAHPATGTGPKKPKRSA